MRKLFLVSLSIFIFGCAATKPAPNYINGYYYMAGDAQCTKGRVVAYKKIACVDKNGNETGYRYAMSKEDVQLWNSMNNKSNTSTQVKPSSVVNCTKLGVLNGEVKTFKGDYCPIGWISI